MYTSRNQVQDWELDISLQMGDFISLQALCHKGIEHLAKAL